MVRLRSPQVRRVFSPAPLFPPFFGFNLNELLFAPAGALRVRPRAVNFDIVSKLILLLLFVAQLIVSGAFESMIDRALFCGVSISENVSLR
jgi:hypothetical protein